MIKIYPIDFSKFSLNFGQNIRGLIEAICEMDIDDRIFENREIAPKKYASNVMSLGLMHVGAKRYPKFSFQIECLRRERKQSYQATFAPSSEVSNHQTSTSCDNAQTLIAEFVRWVRRIESFEELNSINGVNEFAQKYSNEIYQKIVADLDENDTSPLVELQQNLLYDFLERLLENVKVSSEVSEAEKESFEKTVLKAQNDLSKKPAKDSLKSYANVLGKLKTFGLKTAKLIIDVAAKEVIKGGLYSGIKIVQGLITHVT